MADEGSSPDRTVRFSRDPESVAAAAGLVYVQADMPGITRLRWGRGFTYRLPDGSTLRDKDERSRIEELAIPPAWTDVWVCPDPRGHILATGRDTQDRKQYRYHPRWRALRDRRKFLRILGFAHSLPTARRNVGRDLSHRGLPPQRAFAAAFRFLDLTAIRVGNPQYAQANGSYGLTTLRNEHVQGLRGDLLHVEFEGKGGRLIEMEVRDGSLADALRGMRTLSGDCILKYQGVRGEGCVISPDQVNGYLQDVAEGGFSAKDFRSWMATVTVVEELAAHPRPEDPDARLERWLEAVDAAAERLHNTRGVTRSSYLPPGLEELWREGSFEARLDSARRRAEELDEPGRRNGEALALALLEEWLEAAEALPPADGT